MENNFDIIIKTNKTNQIELAHTFELSEQWVVGIREITFPKTWYNIPSDQRIDMIVFDWEAYKRFSPVTVPFEIKKGYYGKEKLIDKINEYFTHFETPDNKLIGGNRQVMSYPTLTMKNDEIILELGIFQDGEFFMPIFSKELGNILGFPREKLEDEYSNMCKLYAMKRTTEEPMSLHFNDKIRGKYNENKNIDHIDIKIPNLFNTFMNDDHRSNLLKMIPFKDNLDYGERISISYDNIAYYPLSTHNINKLNILIMNENNHIVLNEDNFYITLNFKKTDSKPILAQEPLPEGELNTTEISNINPLHSRDE